LYFFFFFGFFPKVFFNISGPFLFIASPPPKSFPLYMVSSRRFPDHPVGLLFSLRLGQQLRTIFFGILSLITLFSGLLKYLFLFQKGFFLGDESFLNSLSFSLPLLAKYPRSPFFFFVFLPFCLLQPFGVVCMVFPLCYRVFA